MSKRKVLYTGYSANMGGIERFLLNICKYIDKEKFEVSFLTFKNQKVYLQEELENKGIKFFEITSRKENYIQYLRDLKKVYSENDFDIIHFNCMNFSLFERIILAKRYSKAKVIIHSHSNNIGNKIGKKAQMIDKIGKFAMRNSECKRIACSKEAGEWLFRDKSFMVLDNGIEIEKFKFYEENRVNIRSELGIDENTEVLGTVGRLVEQKNHKFLIEVFYEYQKLNADSKLLLVGEGKFKSELESQAKRLQIQDKVLFLGMRKDIEKIYSAMDIFVFPSIFEGFGLAVVEAQINGLKCYASTNVAEESNVTGNEKFLELDEGAENWAKKIFESNHERDERAFEKVPDKFKIVEMVKILSKIYEEID